MSPKDNVNLPSHYAKHRIEPIRFLMENRTNPFQFNICKYVLRHEGKNLEEDLFKAIRYNIMYIRFLRQDPDWWRHMTPEDIKKFFEEGPHGSAFEGSALKSYMDERTYDVNSTASGLKLGEMSVTISGKGTHLYQQDPSLAYKWPSQTGPDKEYFDGID